MNCNMLTSINFPSCISTSTDAFKYCFSLANVSLPVCEYIGNSTFYQCSFLTAISLPKCISIGASAFYSCSRFSSIYLANSSVAYLGTNAFYNTGITSSKGAIYVPASLVSAYQTATN